jgi:hypothetical protein
MSQNWPVYFIPGTGQTDAGLAVLYTTIALFGLSAFIIGTRRVEDRAGFYSWYAIELGLIAIGLFGVSLQTNLGDPLNWVGRTSQYVGTIFMLIAVISSFKQRIIYSL